MRLLRARDSDEFAQLSALVVTTRLEAKRTLAITLPTGSTPLPLYERLRREHAAGRFSLDRASVFMLDEYVDLGNYPKGSFHAALQQHLGPVIFNSHTTFHAMRPGADPAFCAAYDAALDEVGGLDLAIVGVGRNGHVGFNEPGTSFHARTHVVRLTEDTLNANFPATDDVERPTRAVTMGLADLWRARSVLMLVHGDKQWVARLLADETVVAEVPATQLLTHPDLSIVVDEPLLRGAMVSDASAILGHD